LYVYTTYDKYLNFILKHLRQKPKNFEMFKNVVITITIFLFIIMCCIINYIKNDKYLEKQFAYPIIFLIIILYVCMFFLYLIDYINKYWLYDNKIKTFFN